MYKSIVAEEISATISVWRAGNLYNADDFAIYNDRLYMCLTSHAATTFDSTKWQPIGDRVEDWQPDTMYQKNMLIVDDAILYRCIATHTSSTASFSSDVAVYWEELGASIKNWQAGKYYRAGSLAIHDAKAYQCLSNHTAAAAFETDFAKWLLLAANRLQDWQPNTGYKADETVIYQGRIYACQADHVSGANWQALFWRKIGLDVTDWQSVEVYNVGDFVLKDNLLYMCQVAHTAADFAQEIANWRQITIGYVPAWTPGMYYTEYQVVTRGSNILRCITPHMSEATFSNTERNTWEVIAAKGAVIPAWQPDTEYGVDEAVIYNDIIYLANTSHTSSATFAADMLAGFEKWRAVGGSGGESGELLQVTKLGVLATKVVELVINYNDTFMLPTVEVLKFEQGDQDQIVTLCAFDNADSGDFVYDTEYVEFDGAMKPRYKFDIPMSTPAALGEGFISESDEIDSSKYKSVANVYVF